MAQTNLRMTQRTIRDIAALEASFPSDETTWSADQQLQMSLVMKEALSFCFQPPILTRPFVPRDEYSPHLWSWLNPSTTLDLWPTQSPTSGKTITPNTASASVTSSGSTFYQSMVGKEIVAYTNDDDETEVGTVGTISAVNAAGTTLTLEAVAAYGNGATAYRWGIVADGKYRLPIEFLGMEGRLFFPDGSGYGPLHKRSEDYVLTYLSGNANAGLPCYFAIRPVAGFTGTAEQQWEILVAPIPNSTWEMRYRMHLNIDVITSFDGSTGDKYLPGGSVYSQLFAKAAKMAVESQIEKQRGLRYSEAMEELVRAVNFDRQHTAPDEFGENVDRGRIRGRGNSWRDDWSGPDVFFNGVQVGQ